MARYSEHDRDNIDATVQRWKERCLLGDGSLVFDDRPDIWTLEHADELYGRFNANPLLGEERAEASSASGSVSWRAPGKSFGYSLPSFCSSTSCSRRRWATDASWKGSRHAYRRSM